MRGQCRVEITGPEKHPGPPETEGVPSDELSSLTTLTPVVV